MTDGKLSCLILRGLLRRIGRQEGVYRAQAAIADRNDIDPTGYRLAGRPDTPCQRGGVGPNVRWSVLFEHEARQLA